MLAETIFNVAEHLSEEELKKLYFMIRQKNVEKHPNIKKKIKKNLITEEDATKFVLKTVFKLFVPNLYLNPLSPFK